MGEEQADGSFNGTIATISTIQHDNWLRVLQVDDAVLVKPDHRDTCSVYKIYNQEQEDLLVTAGARLPPRTTGTCRMTAAEKLQKAQKELDDL